jgi:hypothetical protein
MTIPISWLLLFSYSMIIFINATLIIVVVIVVFLFCVGCLLCVYFCVLCFVWWLCYFVWCVLCLIVVPLPPGENPFAVETNIYLIPTTQCRSRYYSRNHKLVTVYLSTLNQLLNLYKVSQEERSIAQRHSKFRVDVSFTPEAANINNTAPSVVSGSVYLQVTSGVVNN